MTGIFAGLVYGSGGNILNPIQITVLSDFELTPTDANGGIQFNTDGTFSLTGNATVAGSNWRIPTLAGVGTGIWVRLTVTLGSNPNGVGDAAISTWLEITTGRKWHWVRTSTGARTATCTVELASDAAGTSILATCSFTVDVEVN